MIQRRQDGSQRFDVNWEEYKKGFGQVAREFWFGEKLNTSIVFLIFFTILDHLSVITIQGAITVPLVVYMYIHVYFGPRFWVRSVDHSIPSKSGCSCICTCVLPKYYVRT